MEGEEGSEGGGSERREGRGGGKEGDGGRGVREEGWREEGR